MCVSTSSDAIQLKRKQSHLSFPTFLCNSIFVILSLSHFSLADKRANTFKVGRQSTHPVLARDNSATDWVVENKTSTQVSEKGLGEQRPEIRDIQGKQLQQAVYRREKLFNDDEIESNK